MRDDWRADAACKGQPEHLFFPETRGRLSRDHAGLALCRECPVRRECLAEAVAMEDFEGLRGGMTGYQRLRLHRQLQRTVA